MTGFSIRPTGGQNLLGKVLMSVREALCKSGASASIITVTSTDLFVVCLLRIQEQHRETLSLCAGRRLRCQPSGGHWFRVDGLSVQELLFFSFVPAAIYLTVQEMLLSRRVRLPRPISG